MADSFLDIFKPGDVHPECSSYVAIAREGTISAPSTTTTPRAPCFNSSDNGSEGDAEEQDEDDEEEPEAYDEEKSRKTVKRWRAIDIEREAVAWKMGLTFEEYQIKLASAKVIGGFMVREKGSVELERASVYGAVILVPQVARTVGWPRYLTKLVVESYIFLFANFCVQGGLLYMIAKEEMVMNLFGGKMFLCDFGAGLASSGCPGNEWCMGPHGTEVTADRLKDYGAWNTRNFARDAMLSLFPDKAREINAKVDPGEYGVESYPCRWLCCFIFMMSVVSELFLISRMFGVLWAVPAVNEPWIQMYDDDGEEANWLESGEIKLAGMSRFWKTINFLVVFMPKLLLWKLTAEVGITFLMETSDIENIIVNSVALAFVLRIDEMFFELMSEAIHVMLADHGELRFFDEAEEEEATEEQQMEKFFTNQNLRNWDFHDFISALCPSKLIMVLFLTLLFVGQYYYKYCYYAGGGHFFSQPMHLPLSASYSIASAYFPSLFPNPVVDKPYWSMRPPSQEI